jgi:BirA family transcriptional regulator, biotin operon repressor / biotin---[acetyl-CoA-carboxylase] ligase
VISQLSLVAGVAVCEAITTAAGGDLPVGLQLKWPNDVLIGAAKCTGILPEATRDLTSGATIAVIGIGINLKHHPKDLGRPATHLGVHGIAANPSKMLIFLSAALDAELRRWDLGRGFASTLERWRQWGTQPGQRLSVNLGEKALHGSFSGLAEDGALILRDDGGYEHRVTFGDVTLAPVGKE